MALKSFLEICPDSHFPLENLPYGIFKPSAAAAASARPSVAVRDYVLDLSVLSSAGLFEGPLLSSSACFNHVILFEVARIEMDMEGSSPTYECLLFDDDTLYPLSSGISGEVSKNIVEYMITKLGIEEDNVKDLNLRLYMEYGTTMVGLRAAGYDFDYDDYHGFIHGRLPYEWLKPDPVLRSLLHSLPIHKVIFSNGNDAHVAKVLSRLGLEDCFDQIMTFETLNPNHNSSVEDEHNGSANVRIGLAQQDEPLNIPHCIAWKTTGDNKFTKKNIQDQMWHSWRSQPYMQLERNVVHYHWMGRLSPLEGMIERLSYGARS